MLGISIWASLWGSCTGRVRRRTASNRWKIAIFAPIPRASVAMAASVNAGAFASVRHAYCRSRTRFSIWRLTGGKFIMVADYRSRGCYGGYIPRLKQMLK